MYFYAIVRKCKTWLFWKEINFGGAEFLGKL